MFSKIMNILSDTQQYEIGLEHILFAYLCW